MKSGNQYIKDLVLSFVAKKEKEKYIATESINSPELTKQMVILKMKLHRHAYVSPYFF